MLTDFYNTTADKLVSGLTGTPFAWTGEINGVLVNGQGTNRTADTKIPGCSLHQINVKPSKTYRLRFIGATALSFIFFKFQGHDLHVIETNGHYTKLYAINFL